MNDSEQRKLSRLFEDRANIAPKSSIRPVRGMDEQSHRQMKTANECSASTPESDVENNPDRRELFQNFNIGGIEKFLPYYEETKPFQMSDFYKYSSKYRLKVNDSIKDRDVDTTKQSEEELSTESIGNKCSSSDQDRFRSSVGLIGKEGHKMIEATAKTTATKPLICR